MFLLFDIGNTHTHLGLADDAGVLRQANIPTKVFLDAARSVPAGVGRFLHGCTPAHAAMASVVPAANPAIRRIARQVTGRKVIELTSRTVRGVGILYPAPETIGPDRLANALAAAHAHGAPVVVVDFGTAVTFDVVDGKGRYIGGIIAPGLNAMTDYLHEKTALLPRITLRDVKSHVGKSTEEAMLIGAVHGYRGLVRACIEGLRKELRTKNLPVIATGGCAALIARGMEEITAVDPNLTLRGIHLHALQQLR